LFKFEVEDEVESGMCAVGIEEEELDFSFVESDPCLYG